MAVQRSVLILASDPYLAGLYGRKFERDNWIVFVAESLPDAKLLIAKNKPKVILLQKESVKGDIVNIVSEIKSLPTGQQLKIVLLAKETDREEIQRARNAGADAYLLLGHFVPHEALEKIREMVEE